MLFSKSPHYQPILEWNSKASSWCKKSALKAFREIRSNYFSPASFDISVLPLIIKRSGKWRDSYGRIGQVRSRRALPEEAHRPPMERESFPRPQAMWFFFFFSLLNFFYRIAAALDAENQPADRSTVSELWSKAKSFIRVRRKGDVPGDSTPRHPRPRRAPAECGRSRRRHQGSRAAQGPSREAFSPWLEKLKARRAADEALARVEATLLTALGGEDQAKRGG